MSGNPAAEREERFGAFLVQQIDTHELSKSFLEQLRHDFSDGHYRFEAVAELKNMQFLRNVVSWIAMEFLSVEEQAASDMKLVFEEAASNIVRHSYQSEGAKWFGFSLYRDGDQVVFELCDRGVGGNNPELPAKWAEISKEGRPPLQHRGGLGLYLIARIMDELEYHPGGEINRLVMRKTC